MASGAFCPSCGTPTQAGTRFCANCGTALTSPARSADQPATQPTQWVQPAAKGGPGVGGAVKQGFGWALGCLVFAIVLVVILAVLAGMGNKAAPAGPSATPPVAVATQTPTATVAPTGTPQGSSSTTAIQTALPTTAFATFGDGQFIVGEDIAPGTYRTREAPVGNCYWARLSNFTGDNDTLANDNTSGPGVVTIAKTDAGFNSDGCGTWTNDLSRITASRTTFGGNGTFIVGTDFAAGTYRSEPSGGNCYWARLSNFTGDNDTLANDNVSGRAIVTIRSTDKGFKTDGCGIWTKR